MFPMSFQCEHCLRHFNEKKQLNNHTPDCFRRYSSNPPERRCSYCNADYTRKSGSAFRTHKLKCEVVQKKPKTDSAVKQSDRRKKIIPETTCAHCNTIFLNITVGKFGDHQYKCRNNIPNYDQEYQSQYRREIKKCKQLVLKVHPNLSASEIQAISQRMRKCLKDEPNIDDEVLLKKNVHSKIT